MGYPSTREQFGLCHPLCLPFTTIQDLTERNYITSEQHKELAASRLKRDEIDLGKVAKKLDSVTPFSTDESLHNIIAGINTNEGVNVQNLFEIERDIVQEMDGQSVFYSQKRSLNAKTLASSKNKKVSADRSIDPALVSEVSRSLSDGKSSAR